MKEIMAVVLGMLGVVVCCPFFLPVKHKKVRLVRDVQYTTYLNEPTEIPVPIELNEPSGDDDLDFDFDFDFDQIAAELNDNAADTR